VRAFRQVVRNVYTTRLDPARVVRLASETLECYAGVRAELEAFASMIARSRLGVLRGASPAT
jgi:hypothetical protein